MNTYIHLRTSTYGENQKIDELPVLDCSKAIDSSLNVYQIIAGRLTVVITQRIAKIHTQEVEMSIMPQR